MARFSLRPGPNSPYDFSKYDERLLDLVDFLIAQPPSIYDDRNLAISVSRDLLSLKDTSRYLSSILNPHRSSEFYPRTRALMKLLTRGTKYEVTSVLIAESSDVSIARFIEALESKLCRGGLAKSYNLDPYISLVEAYKMYSWLFSIAVKRILVEATNSRQRDLSDEDFHAQLKNFEAIFTTYFGPPLLIRPTEISVNPSDDYGTDTARFKLRQQSWLSAFSIIDKLNLDVNEKSADGIISNALFENLNINHHQTRKRLHVALNYPEITAYVVKEIYYALFRPVKR
ncbi:MAG: hypothetical protein NZT61_00380 [Deltaproteobacteria bacterium]|nr:hypothetical protein [Deltaproteobacteria bacterium]